MSQRVRPEVAGPMTSYATSGVCLFAAIAHVAFAHAGYGLLPLKRRLKQIGAREAPVRPPRLRKFNDLIR